MTQVFVGVGSNVDRDRNVRQGLQSLAAEFGPLRCSRVFECAAVGFVGDAFLNLVVGFETTLTPLDLATRLRALEIRHGRPHEVSKYSPRTLDIDLLLYGDVVQSADGLQLPREDVLRYAFVLWPLAELAPELRHPVIGRTYAELWADFPRASMPPLAPVAFDCLDTFGRGAA